MRTTGDIMLVNHPNSVTFAVASAAAELIAPAEAHSALRVWEGVGGLYKEGEHIQLWGDKASEMKMSRVASFRAGRRLGFYDFACLLIYKTKKEKQQHILPI